MEKTWSLKVTTPKEFIEEFEGGLVAVASAAVASTTTAAVSTATAAAAVSAAAASTAVATSAATSTAAALFARLGFIDGERAPVVLFAVEGGNGALGVIIVGHLDEPEPLAAAGVAIADNLGALNGAKLTEQLLQRRTVHAVAEVPDVQTLTHGAKLQIP